MVTRDLLAYTDPLGSSPIVHSWMERGHCSAIGSGESGQHGLGWELSSMGPWASYLKSPEPQFPLYGKWEKVG